jgi:ferric-dicitrate binding protein FerR (iron transport regulator)
MIITKERIIAFFEDRCSAEEADEIYRYLQENPEWVSTWFNEEEWETFRHTEDLPQSWSQSLLEKVDAAKSPQEGRIRWMSGLKVAAAMIAILLGLVIVWQRYVKKDGLSAETAVTDAGKDTTLINGKSVLQRVTLEDGSVVELSPASRITFHRGFQRDKRTVLLSGEAVFRIAEEKSRPFTVFTRGFSTTVLGTEFRIRAYTDSVTSCIQLLSGKVMVRNLEHPDQTAYLLAGQECTFNNVKNSLGGMIATHPASPSNRNGGVLNSQANGSSEDNDSEILFKNESLTRVLSKLSEFYHTPLRFNQVEMNKRKFTGSVQKDQSLEEALKIITLLNDLHVDREDSIYRVIPGR